MIKTVVGNYPKVGPPTRVSSLRQAISQFDTGKISREELARVEDEVTKEIIEQQSSAGLDVISDGHIRWDDPQTYFARKLQGFSLDGLIRYFDTNTYYRHPIAEAPVRWTEPITVHDYQFAAAHSSRPVRAVIIGPYTLARLSQRKHYRSLRRMTLDIASALNQEARALQAAGAPVIQFDEPAILKHPEDFDLFAEAASVVTEGISRAKTQVQTFFGSLDRLSPQFFELPFTVIGLDFVMGAKNWEFIRKFPDNKELGFGIIDARNTKLETLEEIVYAVKRISSIVPLSRVHISPNCGLEFLPRSSAYAKLVRMVEGANTAQEVVR